MTIDKHRYVSNAIDRARRLRRDMTWPEKLFWSRVKAQQFLGLKFRKQHPIGPFVVDFYCASVSLVVEIDGDSHVDSDADSERQQYLEQLGLVVVRYSNDEVLKELDWVMENLESRLQGVTRKSLP
jgi:very-short-patch-repair endonuclease